ncbi:MAG: alpha/beta hydrolase family protein [Candidatus Helarchaeota archaeon]
MFKLSIKWIKLIEKITLITGVIILSIGLIMAIIFNIILAPSIVSQFSIRTASEFKFFGQEFELDCMLLEPKPQYDYYQNNRPAIVLVHGFMSSKMYFKGLAYELNKRGFVCLCITAPGHGASGGGMAPTWENATLSAVKFLRDHSTTLKIDINRIGLVGHSMGAFSVTIASILDQELGNYWLNATVAIGGPFLNITKGFGNGFSAFLKIPYVYPNLYYDPDIAMQNAIIEGRTNDTTPYNYMNIIGDRDQAFSLESAYELMFGMSSTSFWNKYGITSQSQIQAGTTYGSFNGTARRLVVLPGIGHIIEGQLKTTCIEVINWFEESMKLKSLTQYPGTLNTNTITEEYRTLAIPITFIGTIILIMPLTIYFGNWLRDKKPQKPENAIELENKKMWIMFIIYGASFIAVSLITGPIIQGLNLINYIPTDFLASSMITLPLFIQGILMIPILICLYLFERKKYNMQLNDIGFNLNIKSNIKDVIYAGLLILVLFIFLNLSTSWTIHNLVPWRIFSFLEIFLQIFIAMLSFEILFRGMIQNKLSRYRNQTLIFIPAWKELLGSSFISGLIEGLGLGIIITYILIAGGMPVDMSSIIPENMGISFGGLPPLYIIIPLAFIILEIVLNFVKSWIYRKSNYNILASALFMALILAWILSVLLPATSIFSPRFVYFTS